MGFSLDERNETDTAKKMLAKMVVIITTLNLSEFDAFYKLFEKYGYTVNTLEA